MQDPLGEDSGIALLCSVGKRGSIHDNDDEDEENILHTYVQEAGIIAIISEKEDDNTITIITMIIITTIITLIITIIIIIITMIIIFDGREKEGDTACYRGEALWLDTEGEVHIYLSL